MKKLTFVIIIVVWTEIVKSIMRIQGVRNLCGIGRDFFEDFCSLVIDCVSVRFKYIQSVNLVSRGRLQGKGRTDAVCGAVIKNRCYSRIN